MLNLQGIPFMCFKLCKLAMIVTLLAALTPSLYCQNLTNINEVPISYQGRYRPTAAYAKLKLEQLNKENTAVKASFFNTSPAISALKFHFLGDFPTTSPASNVSQNDSTERAIEQLISQLKTRGASAQQIDLEIENNYPLAERLRGIDSDWLALPSHADPALWLPLKALKIRTFDPATEKLTPISNFTAYSDESFERIRNTYLQLEKSFMNGTAESHIEDFAHSLLSAYQTLISENNFENAFSFPSLTKLKTENFYYHFPFTLLSIGGYLLAVALFSIHRYLPSTTINLTAWGTHIATFLLQTSCLALRCYVLARPPVSNMFETLLFVPWIAVAGSYLLYFFIRTKTVLIASALSSAILLLILHWSGIDNSLENVQPVLDSHYWLITHVLMVVGSYGIFVLGGLLGHIYLLYAHFQGSRAASLETIGKLILQSMYLGTALLIPGTILGGVWAAQSWGRFWDWDPKESWAFISSCTYLIWIHAYLFKKIHYRGLAIGAIVGLIVIVFTWYGVNYILGTGLHSYGFGQGGLFYFGVYLTIELIFLAYFSSSRYNQRPSQEN